MRTQLKSVAVVNTSTDTFARFDLSFAVNLDHEEADSAWDVMQEYARLTRTREVKTQDERDAAERDKQAAEELLLKIGEFITENCVLIDAKTQTEEAPKGGRKIKSWTSPAAVREAEKTLTRAREQESATFVDAFDGMLS